ncbi:Krueppel-like factor 8, partial [Orussus abietinus]|uniref:Krueppel-like factor 8 n=1 Tax=Orussus abietinus TaxID=222816 RepID=UPI000C715CAE
MEKENIANPFSTEQRCIVDNSDQLAVIWITDIPRSAVPRPLCGVLFPFGQNPEASMKPLQQAEWFLNNGEHLQEGNRWIRTSRANDLSRKEQYPDECKRLVDIRPLFHVRQCQGPCVVFSSVSGKIQRRQTSDLDTLLCRQELDRLQRLDEDDADKDPREASSHMEDFFEVAAACRPQASFVSSRSQPAGNDDDVFLRPPLWEDITSSIQKLDPENADMLGSQSHIKMETEDPTSPVLSPVEIKTEPLPPSPTLHLLEGPTSKPIQSFANRSAPQPVVHHRTNAFKTFSPNHNGSNSNPSGNGNGNGAGNNNGSPTNHHPANQQATGNATSPLYGSMTRLMYVSPLTPPISDPGSPLGGPPRRTPPPPYPQPPILNPPHRIQAPTITKFNRRNNPELEKRRVHHCDFIGCTKVYTKSSHLKAHQRIHT